MSSGNVTSHPTFYLAHGDLILHSADNPDDNSTLFRVNNGALVFNSLVFADMSGLLANPAEQDTYDGVPVVRVSNVADELEQLVSALYDPG
jgi:hypothetical protein